jgi:S-adenosylmethionine synthetase
MKTESHHFAEYVSPGHPDRLADAIAESLVDYAVRHDRRALVAVEVAVHTRLVFVDGRMAHKGPSVDLRPLVDSVYRNAGYGDHWAPLRGSLRVEDDLCREELSAAESDIRGLSDDQNVVLGYATADARSNHLPAAHFVATCLGRELAAWRSRASALAGNGRPDHKIFGPDFKLLPHLIRQTDGCGGAAWSWHRLTLSVQHCAGLTYEDQHRLLFPVLKGACDKLEKTRSLTGLGTSFQLDKLCLNGAGDFQVGGPYGDNGLSGKKLVVDHYGPEFPIGGGALCGKDPHKIDRVGPLRARQLAKHLARSHRQPAQVRLAWSPGQPSPYHVEASIELSGAWKRLPQSVLPGLDWFAIETIFDNLRLHDVRWAETVLEGYFTEPGWTWERW